MNNNFTVFTENQLTNVHAKCAYGTCTDNLNLNMANNQKTMVFCSIADDCCLSSFLGQPFPIKQLQDGLRQQLGDAVT